MPFLATDSHPTPSTYYTQGACAIAFWVFTFVYLFFYQNDVLAAGQHVLSGGQTHYNRLVGALLITLTLFVLRRAVSEVSRLQGSVHALTYFPSLLVLTIITDVSSDIDRGFSFGGWLIACPLLVVAFVALVVLLRQMPPPGSLAGHGFFSRHLWVNMLIMAVMFVAVGLFSNGDEAFHYRMKMERLIAEERYDDALKVGRRSLVADPALTMLRAHALEKKRMLGDHFFDYPVEGEPAALLPDTAGVRTILLPDSVVTDFARTPRAKLDYRLMRLLLERDLDTFAYIVERVYPDSVMPRHFAEALLLHQFATGKNVTKTPGDVAMTDFLDFRKMAKESPARIAANQVRRTYRNTYWYYYKYGMSAEK